jgi:O-antigen/teichoic acid export membrane protein
MLVGPLLQLPVMIAAWGIDALGGWLTATALASLCTIAAYSIFPAIQAHVAMSIGRGEHDLAANYHRSGLILCVVATLLLLAATLAGYHLTAATGFYAVPGIGMRAVDLLFLASAANGLAAYNSSVMGSVGRFGLGNAVEAGRRAIELLATLALVGLAGASVVEVAAMLCVSAALGVVVTSVLLRRVMRPVLPPGHFDARALYRCSNAILGAFCIAYAYPQLFILGPRILIGVTLNNTAVALYTVATSLVRVLRQVADVMTYPFLNDFSYAFGENRRDRVQKLLLLPSRLCLYMALAGTVGILAVGPWAIRLLTHQSFPDERLLLAILAVAAVIECTSLVAQTLLVAIGRTLMPSLVLLVVGALVMVVAVPLSAKIGLAAFALAILAGTLVHATALWFTALSAIGLPLHDFVRQLVRPPVAEILGEGRMLLSRLRR